jgi:hypothetical protein
MSVRKLVATAEIKKIPNKKKPGAEHGFQVCKVLDADGLGYEKVEQYFDPSRASFALQPGEYVIEPSEPKVVDGRLVIYPNFVAVKAAAKAA